MGDTVSMDDFRKEQKRREFKQKVCWKAQDIAYAIRDNKELIAAGITAGAALFKGYKTLARGAKQRDEKWRRERTIYDRRNGCWVETKHKLSSDELCELDWRRRHGESVTQALRNMKLMK